MSTKLDQKFAKMGLNSPIDFVLHLPRRYLDYTKISTVAQAQPGEFIQLQGQLRQIGEVFGRHNRRVQAQLMDHTGIMKLVWFHYFRGWADKLKQYQQVRIAGYVSPETTFGLTMAHPEIMSANQPLTCSLTPEYPLTTGIEQHQMRQRIRTILATFHVPETLPAPILQKWHLMGIDEAIRCIHMPTPADDPRSLLELTHPACQRIKVDELLAQQLALEQARQQRYQVAAYALRSHTSGLAEKIIHSLAFQLTQAQQRVCQEIWHDMQRSYPMNRLLQGDVGSGKTVVALWAAAKAVEAGCQVAIMAPTEILAKQHYHKFQQWLAPFGVDVQWLSGAQKGKKKTLQHIATGQAQVVIGTQAIIQDKVQFQRLGLVVVDEQHRFGVAQRLNLLSKGQGEYAGQLLAPHQLSMSATPIPRSLAMTYLADLDVSVLDELPPGRQAIETKIYSKHRLASVYQSMQTLIEQGSQVYWVCPLIEESEKLDLQAAQLSYEALQQHFAPTIQVGLLHGRMKPAEKEQVMADFVAGKIQILVSTTVIEVGIDVPQANIIVIENAERFGLAQLHQLRGRVGRGGGKSYCILMPGSDTLSETAKLRLNAMRQTASGFEIAQRDLQIRGPGDILGERQSGVPELRFLDLERDAHIIQLVKDILKDLHSYPKYAQAHLEQWLPNRCNFLRS